MTYRTLDAAFTFVDEPVKGSRFLALVAPASTEDDAMAVLAEARAEWSDASHHTFAYRLQGGRFRSSDAGEPGGSAGRPILAQLDGHDVVDVMAVVVRWFGGTKLGVGGLMRAYGGCAGRALDRAQVVARVPQTVLLVHHAYNDTGPVQAVVGALHLDVLDTTWGAAVTLTLRVPTADVPEVAAALRDRTAGRVRVADSEGEA